MRPDVRSAFPLQRPTVDARFASFLLLQKITNRGSSAVISARLDVLGEKFPKYRGRVMTMQQTKPSHNLRYGEA